MFVIRIKDTIEKIPGGLMVVPLLLGASINTIDQLHLKPIMNLLKSMNIKYSWREVENIDSMSDENKEEIVLE